MKTALAVIAGLIAFIIWVFVVFIPAMIVWTPLEMMGSVTGEKDKSLSLGAIIHDIHKSIWASIITIVIGKDGNKK